MKICWDNLEKFNIFLSKRGNFYSKNKNCTYYYQDKCFSCKDPFLSRKKIALTCSKKCYGNYFSGENNNFYGKKHSEKTKEIWRRKFKDKTWEELYGNDKSKIMKENISKSGSKNPSWKGGYGNIPLYDTFVNQIDWCEEVRRNKEDQKILEVKCAYCGRWYIPSLYSINSRIKSINSNYKGESRFYCSDHCKKCCPVYGKTAETLMKEDAVRSGRDPWWEMVREVQPQLRQMVFERDGYKCIKCGSKEFLHCHHKEGILWEPLQSADIDMCITVCKYCHMVIHKIEGCKPSDMRCNPEEKG